MSKILLRNLGAHLNVESPTDWVMSIKSCALDANGFAVLDLKKDVREGATVYYQLLSASNVFGAAASTTSEGLTVNKGSIIIGLTASDEDDPVTEATTVVPAASGTCLVLLYYPASEMAMHGESFA